MTADKHFFGIYPAIVWDTNDPENRLRLRLRIPMVLGEETSDWALPCLPPRWRDGVVKPHDDHTFTDKNDGTGASGNVARTLTHNHNHELVSAVPTIGTTTWVMFIAGDQDFPVWIGTA